MDPLPSSTRRANRWLFVALVIFAISLAVACFLWMRVVVRKDGGVVDPQPRTTSFQRTPTLQADFVLPTAPPCLT
ncbi:MAG: hypothetical protein INR62_00150 [Rhodospirillales bacterium]|nr:hypothetical protein [Acetobacter sp.]